MAFFYFDTSALVKRYVREAGSDWIKDLLRTSQGHRVVIARITAVEVVSAIARRLRSGTVTPDEARSVLRRFRKEFKARFIVIPITERLVERAMKLARQHALRGYDAVQLAAGITANERLIHRGRSPLTFCSADLTLNAAASTESLPTDDPNLHP